MSEFHEVDSRRREEALLVDCQRSGPLMTLLEVWELVFISDKPERRGLSVIHRSEVLQASEIFLEVRHSQHNFDYDDE